MAGMVVRSAGEYLKGLSELCARVDAGALERFADLLFDAWKGDRAVLIFGNGGSAYTASHYVTDFVKTAQVEGQRRLRAISLVDNYGMTTAIGNDMDYAQTMSHPVESYGRAGDLAVAISCSGNSPNVVRACEAAKRVGMKVVALTGFSGGKIGAMADLHVHVASENYGLIEDLHLSCGHVAAQLLLHKVSTAAGAR